MTRATTRSIDPPLRICVYEDGTAWSGSRLGGDPLPCPIRGLVLPRGWWAVTSSVTVPDSVSTKVPKASPASAAGGRGWWGPSAAGCSDCLHRESLLSRTSRRNSSGIAQAGALPGSPQRKPPWHSVARLGPALV